MMITVRDLSYSFPQKNLYNSISFTLEKGQHCAFIGTSGSGKSTLVDLLMNPDDYMFDGTLEVEPGCRIGYVSQFSSLDETNGITVFEYIGQDFLKLQKELASICTEMETASELDVLLERYQQTLDAYDAIGGDDFESLIHRNLTSANLISYRDRLVSELSGGEFKLIQVMKEMLIRPDLLIMDEPDVFLDFENLNALKDLINSHKGMLLVITHNRYLLNHCFNKILHLENMELQEFDGRYMDYNFSLLETKIELQELAAADTEEIERNEAIIGKLRTISKFNTEAARGKSLNARVKIQERLEARRIKAPFVEIKQPKIRFPSNENAGGHTALNVTDYHISFDDLLLEHVNFEIGATDKVALVGPNGTGKTTLLREIFERLHPSIQLGEGVEMAYLSQLQGETIDESQSILDEFFDAGFQTNHEIQSYLSHYGFEEEVLHQTIGALSGGEKNLLQLAKIAAGHANLLLLDEPTSHLDTYSQIALEQALEAYTGAVLMISHDFYSIVNCMDHVLYIEDKTVRKISMRKFRKMIYAGHFDKDYLELELKKKTIETKIALALQNQDFELAKALSEELGPLIQLL